MILVVGAGGFVGSAVAQLAAREGAGEVHGLVRTSRPATPPGRGGGLDQVTWHVGDARAVDLGLSADAAKALLAGVRQIVVAAGRVDFAVSLAEARQEHLLPLLGVLQFARRCIRLESLVYVSSLVAVGEVPYRVRSDELPSAPKLRNFYEWVKYEGERLLRDTDLPVRVVRPGHVLDAEDGSCHAHEPAGLIQALPHLAAGWPVPVETSARYWCAPVDLVAQVTLALAHPDVTRRSVWAVDPASPTLGELFDMLAFRHGVTVRAVRPTRMTPAWLGPLTRRLRSDLPRHLTAYLDQEVQLDLACLDELAGRADVHLPASRDYVCRTVDGFVDRLRTLR